MPENSSLIGLLDPHREVTGFVGRNAELGELLAWCADGQDAPVRLVTGPSGAGKTRLAVEFAHRMRARGWRTRWLGPADGSDGQTTAPAAWIVQRKSLVIIDAADARSELAELLTELVRAQPQARILLLATDAGSWCDQAELAGPVAHALITAARSALIELSAEVSADLTDQEVAALAGIAFAAGLAQPSRAFKLADAGESGQYVMLDLHVAALVATVLEQPEPVNPHRAAAALLGLEQEFWTSRAGELGVTAEPGSRRQLVAAGLLLGADTAEDAAATTAKVAGETGLAAWLHDVLGGPPQAHGEGQAWPAKLARLHIATELGSASQFADRCLAGLDAAGLRRVIPLLAGEAGGRPQAAAPEAAVRLVASQVEQLKAPNPELIPILRSVPYPDPIWAKAGAAACGLIVRQLADDSDEGTRAYWLNSLSARLWLAGRQLEAVSAAEEAVSLRRDLAADAPDRYLASLAVSLSYLGIQYSGLGRTDDAYKVTEEAVSVRRKLAEESPDRYGELVG
jgi:hypothetical protein